MPCLGPSHSCNSILSVRSPLGEVRIGASGSAHPSPPAVWLPVRVFLTLREAFAHRRQRRALATLDRRLLEDIGVSGDSAARETSKPVWK